MRSTLIRGLFLLAALTSALSAAAAIRLPWPAGHRGSDVFPSRGDTLFVTFPVEFDVLPPNRLYVRGERITRVRFTVSPAGRLLLNGVGVVPPEKCPDIPVVRAEETYLRVFGDIPYVRELMDSQGKRASEATKCYYAARDSLRVLAYRTYGAARAAEASEMEASEETLQAIREFDGGALVDWEKPAVAGHGLISLWWKGENRKSGFSFEGCGAPPRTSDGALVAPSAPRTPTGRDKARYAVALYDAVTCDPGPTWRVITCGGSSQFGGVEDIAKAEAALEAARNFEECEEGLLGRLAILEIVGREQEMAGRQRLMEEGGASSE